MLDNQFIFDSFISGKMDSFYKNYYSRLIAFASKQLGPRLSFMAEDCVQEAIMSIYARREEIDGINQLKAYLMASIRNNALMVHRKDDLGTKYLEMLGKDCDADEDLYLEILEQDIYSRLFAAVESLPEIYRQVFDLSFEKGLKSREIAEMLHVADITVKKRKARLLDLLRAKLGNDIGESTIRLLIACSPILTEIA